MKKIRKIKKGLDCVLMKRSIQEQLSKEMKDMNPAARLAYIRQQVQGSPFSDVIKHEDSVSTRKGGCDDPSSAVKNMRHDRTTRQ